MLYTVSPPVGAIVAASSLAPLTRSTQTAGVRMNFYCSDSRGHSVAEIKLRGDGCAALGEVESVALRIPIEPAGLDSFLAQIVAGGVEIGSRAFLPMAM